MQEIAQIKMILQVRKRYYCKKPRHPNYASMVDEELPDYMGEVSDSDQEGPLVPALTNTNNFIVDVVAARAHMVAQDGAIDIRDSDNEDGPHMATSCAHLEA